MSDKYLHLLNSNKNPGLLQEMMNRLGNEVNS